MKSREYWDDSFDERYKKLQEDVINKKRLPLKVSLGVTVLSWLSSFFSLVLPTTP